MRDFSSDSWFMTIPHDEDSLRKAQEDELLFTKPCRKENFSGYPSEVRDSDCYYCSAYGDEDCPLNYEE